MDQRITDLKSTTFSGRRLTRRQIADVQETVALFPNDSSNGPAKTICEHLGWTTARGACRVGALESHGILTLPPKREDSIRDMRDADRPAAISAPDPRPEIAAPLAELRPLRVEPVTDAEDRQLWNASVDRHHYLGYRRPFRAHVRYFVTDRQGRRLGCLLSGAARRALPCRDRWIGWSDRVRDRNRHLMVVNPRYPVFPWVVPKNLASKNLASPVPGMAAWRLADDRERIHGWRSVLCGTLKDETRFRATCYRAANRERIGETAGKARSRKGVHVTPLREGCRKILRGERDAAGPKPPTRAGRGRSAASDRRFPEALETPGAGATAVAAHGDTRWQKRRRVFDSLLIMLFVLRLVAAPRGAGIPDHPVRALGAVRGVDGLRGARQARRGRVPAPAHRDSRPKPPLEGPQMPRCRRLEDRPAEGARGPRLPRRRGRPLSPGHGQRPLPATRPDTGRPPPVHPRERARGGPHAPRARRRRRRDRPRQGLLLLRDGAGPPGARAALRLPHKAQRQPRVRRLHRLRRARPNRHRRRAPGRAFAPGPDAPGPPREIRRRGHGILSGDIADRRRPLRNPAPLRPLPRTMGHRGDVQKRKIRDRMVPRQVRARRAAGTLRGLRPAHPDPPVLQPLRRRPQRRRRGRGPARHAQQPAERPAPGREGDTGALFPRQAGAVRDSVARIMAGLSRCIQRERPGRSNPRESKRPGSRWIRRTTA